ncbi:peptidoglycan LD-endopeptidase LytH [uncultured bacterium]|nr:peptidoglycan LD-endopeptidase LytH [uncultured bacterium]
MKMPPSFKKFLITVLFPLFIATGCIGPGVYHKVGKGETLWRISKTYGVDIQDVAELNDIRDPAELSAGRLLYIPGVSQVRKVKPYVPPSKKKNAEADAEVEKEEPEGRVVIQRDRFLWPVSGKVISNFGMRNGTRHGGIDIKAAEGVPVKAADSGEVAYIDSDMRGYGKIVILKHSDGFFTVYAHNKENLVKMGEKVNKGASIATVGRSGNATTTHLHFEVRSGKTVRNPLFFLP